MNEEKDYEYLQIKEFVDSINNIRELEDQVAKLNRERDKLESDSCRITNCKRDNCETCKTGKLLKEFDLKIGELEGEEIKKTKELKTKILFCPFCGSQRLDDIATFGTPFYVVYKCNDCRLRFSIGLNERTLYGMGNNSYYSKSAKEEILDLTSEMLKREFRKYR